MSTTTSFFGALKAPIIKGAEALVAVADTVATTASATAHTAKAGEALAKGLVVTTTIGVIRDLKSEFGNDYQTMYDEGVALLSKITI